MNLEVNGKGLQVSEYLEDIVTKKASKLERYFKKDTTVYVTLSIEKSRHICEVTVPFDGVTLRAEEASGDMYQSIDASLKKLERQIRRHRTRLEKRLRPAEETMAPVFYEEEVDEVEAQLVRRKQFTVKPMDIEEAKLQMELLGHEFFLFKNTETDSICVLYRRKDGDLGLLEPDYE